MKYVIALVASGAVILFWAVLGAMVGWTHGGGFVGMIFMWTIVAGIWGVIMAKFPDKPGTTKATDSSRSALARDTEHLRPNNTSGEPRQPIDDKPYYAQAMTECAETATGRDLGIWAKAFSLSNGDALRTQAKYIELRVSDLVRSEQSRRSEMGERLRAEAANVKSTQDSTAAKSVLADPPTAIRWEGHTCIRWAFMIEPDQLRVVNLTTSQELLVHRSDARARVKVSASEWTNKNVVIRGDAQSTYAFAADAALCKSVLNWLSSNA